MLVAEAVRHEALIVRVGVKDAHRWVVVAARWSWRQSGLGSRRAGMGAASTKSGRFRTAGWIGLGERDEKVYARDRCCYAS